MSVEAQHSLKNPVGGPEVINFGVDWLTVTSSTSGEVHPLRSLASEFVTLQMRKGHPRKTWGASGYSGFSSEGIHYGIRPRGIIAQVTSDLARENWTRYFDLAENVTRIDLQFTIRYKCPPPFIIRKHHAEALRYCEPLKRKPAVRFMTHNTKGDTLYLGERVSPCFGRVYDKGKQSKLDHYAGCVRYELQLNGDRALHASSYIRRNPHPSADAAAQAAEFFRKRGLLHIPISPACLYSGHRPRPDNLSRLRWLQNSVQPSVTKLVESGLLGPVLDSLGLSDEMLLDHLVRKHKP